MALISPQSATPRLLLLGGGYTLQRLAARLEPASFVITSRRAEQCAAWRDAGLIAHQVSIEHEDGGLTELFARYPGIEVLIDSVPPLRSGDPAAGVKNVVHALRVAPHVKRIMYLSTTGVFGVRDGSVVNEDTPPRPWNPQGEARYVSELAYRESARAVTALRLPAIYGPDRGIHVSLRAGSYRLVDDGSSWSNRIHVDDLATVLYCAALFPLDRPLPPVLCVADDEPTQARDVVRYICEREGIPFPASISQEEVLRAGGYTMLSSQRVQNGLMKQVLGVELQYPSFKSLFHPPGVR